MHNVSFSFLTFHLWYILYLSYVLLSFNLFPSPLSELGQDSVPSSTHNATVVVSAAGVMPYLQGRAGGGDLNSAHSISTNPSSSSSTACDRQPAPPGTMVSAHPQGQSYSLGISNSGLGPPPPKPPGGVYTSAGQHNSSDGCPLASMVSANPHILHYKPLGHIASLSLLFCISHYSSSHLNPYTLHWPYSHSSHFLLHHAQGGNRVLKVTLDLRDSRELFKIFLSRFFMVWKHFG